MGHEADLQDGENEEAIEFSIPELLQEEIQLMQSFVKASEDVPVFFNWEVYSSMFPVLTQTNEYGVRVGWFWLARTQYGFLSKMVENDNAFLPEIGPQMESILKEVKTVFPKAKKLQDLSGFFTIEPSEVAMIGLANDLGVPELLSPDTAPFLFGHLTTEVRSKILEKIKEKGGKPSKELKPAMGFVVPVDNGDYKEDEEIC